MVKEFPTELMDNIVREMTKLQKETDFGYILRYNEYLEFLHRVMLDKARDPEKVAARIRTTLQRKKMKLTNQASTPVGEEYELFKKINQASESPYQDFKNILYKEISDRARTQEIQYTVAYPLNLGLKQNISSKLNEIAGSKRREIEFEIVPYSAFAAVFAAQDIPPLLLNKFNDKFSFCIFKDICARTEDYTIDYCNKKLASILGLLALTFGGTVTFGSKPEAAGKILLSYALLFKNGNYANYYFFGENKPPSSFEKVDHTDVEKFLGFVSLFNEIKSKGIIDQLSDALAAYFEASVEDDMASAYLKYWICMENCLLTSTQEKMIRRLKGLPFWRQDLYVTHQILLMPQIRNDYVHELKTEVSQFDRNFVHNVVGNLIRYLLRNASKFSDKNQIDLFLELVSSEDIQYLRGHKKMAELARKEIQDYRSSNIGA